MKQESNSETSHLVPVKTWRTRLGSGAVFLAAMLLPAMAPAQDGGTQPTVVERGPNHEVVTTATGGFYTHLACGMNYWQDGQWTPSQEVINIVNGYGVADQGQHSATFSPSVVDLPAVQHLADGKQFRSRILGLAYFDRASGKSTLFCVPKDSIGVVKGNRVLYQDAFSDGVNCDVRYTYKRDSLTQEILVRAQFPASPEAYSLNPNSTLLQIWTEFFDPPVPEKQTTLIYQESDPVVRQAMVEPDVKDESLTFGQLYIGRGKAFGIATAAIQQAGINVEEEVPVCKEWVCTPDAETGLNRWFLIESVDFSLVKPLLDTLPASAGLNRPNQNGQIAGAKPGLALGRSEFLASLPRAEHKRSSNGRMQLAQAGGSGSASKGVDIDYTTLVTFTNFTFATGQTYVVTNTVTLSGTNTLEVAIIKFSTNGLSFDGDNWNVVPVQITVSGSGAQLNCATSQARPAVFTAIDDNSYGETISGSTGSPSGYYGSNYLYFSSVQSTLSNIRILYATTGIGYNYCGGLLTHAQFYSCQNALYPTYAYSPDLKVRNVLAASCANFVSGYYSYVRVEHLTLGYAYYLMNMSSSYLYLTNSLLVGVGTSTYTGGTSNVITSSSPFQNVGGGYYYLADNTYRGAGTTNIDPTLAKDLKLRTTYPPIVLANPITVDTVLSPQAQRETGIPDLGYAYDPLDWIVSGGVVLTNATLTLTNGVAIGISGSVGLKLQDGSHLNSVGSPLSLNRLVRLESVQELGGTTNAKTALLADDLVSSTLPEARLRFTELSVLGNSGAQFAGGGNMGVLAAQDCRILGGGIFWTNNGTGSRALSLTNSLFERTTNTFGSGADAFTLYARNNLFKNGGSRFAPTNSNNWSWSDNVFDTCTNSQNANAFNNDYNGFISTTELASHGSHDQVTTLTWQAGPLGIYYQPTNSAFTNRGSVTASAAGLYHYCIFTNQVKEASSQVSIGLHYVAVDANGNPDDADGDGFPDYLEDTNGNGSVDSGETDWQSYNSKYGVGSGPGLQVFTPLK